jgi:hypothetical protein
MRFSLSSLLAISLVWQLTGAQPTCGTCTNDSPSPIQPVPPPWLLKATVYALPIPPAFPLPIKAHSPLKRNSTAMQGDYIGSLGAMLIVRYSEAPVGPYDELVLLPGYFEYPRTLADGSVEIRRTIRGTRFYVSQKYTYWNGRISMCSAF